MRELDNFNTRLDTEFALLPAAIEQKRCDIDREYHGRQQRFVDAFMPAIAKLRQIWEPRSDALLSRFKDIIHVEEDDDFTKVTFSFDSSLAQVTLRFSFRHDPEVRNMILDYDLEILPILMKFDSNSTLELPLAAFDEQAATAWLEDRLVSFVHSFVELNKNQHYLNDQMVEDPVARVRLPKVVARETLDCDGRTYYFISAQTRDEFEKRQRRKKQLAASVEKHHALRRERLGEGNDLGGEA
jgi:YHS domain-containing protein